MFVLRKGVPGDSSAELWELTDAGLADLFGQPRGEPVLAEQPIAYHLMPRVEPEALAQPLRLHAMGDRPAGFLGYQRMGVLGATMDLIASEGLYRLLADARLPPHVALDCEVFVQRGLLPSRSGESDGPHRFKWLWWKEPLEQLDLANTRFSILRRDATRDEATFELVDDLRQVQQRGRRSGFVVMAEPPLSWRVEPAPHTFDLAPVGIDFHVSDALAERIARAKLPGVLLERLATP